MGKCLVLGLWISYRPTGSWTDNGYKLTGLRSVALQGANSSLDFRREKTRQARAEGEWKGRPALQKRDVSEVLIVGEV